MSQERARRNINQFFQYLSFTSEESSSENLFLPFLLCSQLQWLVRCILILLVDIPSSTGSRLNAFLALLLRDIWHFALESAKKARNKRDEKNLKVRHPYEPLVSQ